MTLHIHGTDLFGEPIQPAATIIGRKFGTVPPFTRLDTMSGEWQSRKEAWIGAGVHETAGRRESLAFVGREDQQDAISRQISGVGAGNTSFFDPTLAESLVEWFSPVGGVVLDPFAGGSARGLVCAAMGRDYFGIELRQEQIDANESAADAFKFADRRPLWTRGDASVAMKGPPPRDFDFLLACPPYGSLEKYSDDPADLSNMTDADFDAAYTGVIADASRWLSRDSFAAFVVGSYRNKAGYLRDLPGITVQAFASAGVHLYNHAVLLTSLATVGVRTSAHFTGNRKLGNCHQHVLVFVKGDWRKAANKAALGYGEAAA